MADINKAEFLNPWEERLKQGPTALSGKFFMPYLDGENQSSSNCNLTENGQYDVLNLSRWDSYAILKSIKGTKQKYPRGYYGLGFANEVTNAKYAPRYILNELVVQKFTPSPNPYDLLGVAWAYLSKGAYYRQNAIEFFEEIEPYISEDVLIHFMMILPLAVYARFMQTYEAEHNYERAIELAYKAKDFSVRDGMGGKGYDKIIEGLREKKKIRPSGAKESSPPGRSNLKRKSQKQR